MLRLVKRFIKFIGTSAVGSIVDTLVLWLLSDLVFNKGYFGEYIVSPVISFQCAVIVNFTLAYFYIWRDRTLERTGDGTQKIFKFFLVYDLSCSAVFLIRLGAMLLIGKFTGWDVVICNILAMCFSGLLNFTIENLVIFRKQKKTDVNSVLIRKKGQNPG